MKIIISHPTSNQFNRTAVNGLFEANMLLEFHTSIAAFPGSNLDKIAAFGPLKILKRRQFDKSLKAYTHTYPWIEAGRIMASKAGIKGAVQHETGYFCLDEVYKKQDELIARRLKRLSQNSLKGVYAYEDGALESFREAYTLGLARFYDLPIGYWRTARKLLEVEKERWPEWASTLTGFLDSTAKLMRKDEELALADRIFVASRFTASTLKDFPEELCPVEIIPYGFPEVNDNRIFVTHKQGPLKLLFVGGLSQRKGIADLFSAVNKIGSHISLTIVGRKTGQPCAVLDTELKKHTWIQSVPHSEILKLMREHDILVFPSLFEGFGMVITEAMSQGTPVITTDRTAGADFIQHGRNGWLVEAGCAEKLQVIIEEIISKPEIIAEVGRNAMETARRRPWEVYGRELAKAIQLTSLNIS